MDGFVIFTLEDILEDIPAQSAMAGGLGKRRLVSVGVSVQTLKTESGLRVRDGEWVWEDPSSDLTPHEIS